MWAKQIYYSLNLSYQKIKLKFIFTALTAVVLTSATLSSARIKVTGWIYSAIQSVGNKSQNSAICLQFLIKWLILKKKKINMKNVFTSQAHYEISNYVDYPF